MTTLGPNVRRLIFERMSLEAIPPNGGFADGLKFLSSKESIAAGFTTAKRFVEDAITCVRQAEEPNPWKESTDEDIAGEILNQLQAQKRGDPCVP